MTSGAKKPSTRSDAQFESGVYRLSLDAAAHDQAVVACDRQTRKRFVVEGITPVALRLSRADQKPFVVGQMLVLDINADIGPVTGCVTNVAASGFEATVSLTNLSLTAAQDVVTLARTMIRRGRYHCVDRPDRQVETIREGARIRAITRALIANRGPATLVVGDVGNERRVVLRPGRVEPDYPLPLQWDVVGPPESAPFAIEAVGYNAVFRFEVTRSEMHDGFLAVPVPDELMHWRSDRSRRVAAPAGATVTFRHPVWPELYVRRPLRDVSFDGLAFATSAVKDLLYPGLSIGSIIVDWNERLRIELRAVVRHVSDDIEGTAEIAGLSIEPATGEDAVHWSESIGAISYEHTRMDGSFTRDLWEMYDRSGYFGLSSKSEAQFRPLREAFATTSRHLAAAPDLGCQVVWPSSRGVEAAVSLLKIYEGSTFLYQLARQHGRTPVWSAGRQIVRDVYLHAIEHVRRDPTLRWMVVWIQCDARFSRLVHHDFSLRYVADGRAAITRFRALEGSVSARPDDAKALAEWEIGSAHRDEIERLLSTLARTRPAPWVDAHDFVLERFWLKQLERRWLDAHLVRARDVLVARREGRAVAAAVLEYASDGLHLFGLLDCVRIVGLEPGGDAAFDALLAAARAWFRARGKAKFVYVQEAEDLEHPLRDGFVDLGLADTTILSAELIPELLEFIYEVTAPRDVPPLKPDRR